MSTVSFFRYLVCVGLIVQSLALGVGAVAPANDAASGPSLALAARNEAPTDILLSSHAINPFAGPNAVVGSLSARDPDSTQFVYTLVAGDGATHNAWFSLDGATLRVNNAAAMAGGVYTIRVQVDDLNGGTLAKPLALTVTAANDHTVAQVSAGSFASSFITTDGALWEMGLAVSPLPNVVTHGVVFVDRGNQGSAFVKTDGSLWVSGMNAFGVVASTAPVQVANNVAAVAIAGDTFASVGFTLPPPPTFRAFYIKTDGSLWAVGRNPNGELGDGSTTDRAEPTQIAAGVISVSTGNEHTVFVKADGTLWAMGLNTLGRLGDGSTTTRLTPVRVAAGVVLADAGGAHTVFVTADGTLWGMGNNLSGQLGDGTNTNRASPVRIASGVVSASAGSQHTLFVKTDGTLWAMGGNDGGQLGDGTVAARSTPVQIASNVGSASAGYSHSIFAKTDGTLWTMGSNAFGQLGDGSTIQRHSPVQLLNVASVTAQPSHQSAALGQALTLAVAGSSALPLTYQWKRNGAVLPSETSSTLTLTDIQPWNTGLYTADLVNGGAVSAPAIVGLTTTQKVTGVADEVQANVFVPANGRTYDQVLLRGNAAAITADHAVDQLTRISFIDLSDDIVQVELSGPGTLSLVLDGAGSLAAPINYNQTINYVKGHAGIVIADATEATNLTIFTVGRATSENASLFKDNVSYDGVADLAFVAIASRNGKFGGLRTGNVSYLATKGVTGLYAPNVEFTGPVYLGDIVAAGSATPMIMVGRAADARITGGNLAQANGQAVRISGLAALKFTAGQDSHGRPLPAQANRGVLDENGVDVTARVAVSP